MPCPSLRKESDPSLSSMFQPILLLFSFIIFLVDDNDLIFIPIAAIFFRNEIWKVMPFFIISDGMRLFKIVAFPVRLWHSFLHCNLLSVNCQMLSLANCQLSNRILMNFLQKLWKMFLAYSWVNKDELAFAQISNQDLLQLNRTPCKVSLFESLYSTRGEVTLKLKAR